MTRYFAEVNSTDKTVQRVVVCNDPAWLTEHLGGTWAETADPYATEPQVVTYCGPGHGYDPEFPEQFASQWVQPVEIAEPEPGEDPWTWYPFGARVFHNGRIWRSRVAENVWEPGVAAWHDAPPGAVPTWFQPTGSADAYPAIDEETGAQTIVTHNGQTWVNTHGDGNVWEPGAFGWTLA